MGKLGLSLLLTAFGLALLGVFILYESSTYTALLSIGDKYYFFKNQAMWMVIGVVACILVSKIPYKNYYKLALPLLIFSLFLLLLVFFPGIGLELKGAHRWINLGFTSLQPSEVLKITLIIYLAAWLSVKEQGRFIAFMMLVGLCVFLVLIQPDMDTAFIIGVTATIVYFLSGAPIRNFVFIIALVLISGLALINLEPYRAARLAAFTNFDTNNLQEAPYHTKQILIALGSGGVTGLGFGNSIQKYAYLPESNTDSIFAIYSEEAGFIGATFLIGLFFAFVAMGLLIAAASPDLFGKLLGAGIVTFIGLQAFINIAAQVVLIPLAGIPLPFISYGGTSLIINFISVGILLSIARGRKREDVRRR